MFIVAASSPNSADVATWGVELTVVESKLNFFILRRLQQHLTSNSNARHRLRRSYLFRMPPSIARSSLSSIARCRPSTSITARSFTTTSPLSSIGPENPKFIEIPTTKQPQLPPTIVVKGTLPPPRELFPRREKNGYKLSPQYFKKTTPLPKTEKKPANDFVAWKQRMADTRRNHLREGLRELYNRKKANAAKVAGTSKARSRMREERLHAPQREDERLTSPTITESVRTLHSGSVPDPDREARLALKAERGKAKEMAREEQRKNALHTLYMHAREFIVTEQQLDAEIEKIFTEEPHAPGDRRNNIWESLNAPPTVGDMLSQINNTQRKATKFHETGATLTGLRVKKIAEELTGGKMD